MSVLCLDYMWSMSGLDVVYAWSMCSVCCMSGLDAMHGYRALANACVCRLKITCALPTCGFLFLSCLPGGKVASAYPSGCPISCHEEKKRKEKKGPPGACPGNRYRQKSTTHTPTSSPPWRTLPATIGCPCMFCGLDEWTVGLSMCVRSVACQGSLQSPAGES